MSPTEIILPLIEKLTGQECPLPDRIVPDCATALLDDSGCGLGYSQFNELLLTLGYDRVTHSFFQWLVDEQTEYRVGASFRSIDDLRVGVDRFRKLGMLRYGNVKYAFKRLSSDSEDFAEELSFVAKISEQMFKERHQPIHPIEQIPGDKTYYLGHIIGREIQQRASAAPDDAVAQSEEKIRQATVAIGKRNFEAYLVSDHLDVYIATSMRERHEYQAVYQLAHEIFGHPLLVNLKLRYFDPTQAYCIDRVDKGLAEGLMLKRAHCTVYFVQESDTLGKDSELASTLAQGKPVIAYVPDPPSDYAEKLIGKLGDAYPGKEARELVLEQLRVFDPGAAWTDPGVRRWIEDRASFDEATATLRLQDAISRHYNNRAKTIRDIHPLGIQVNLNNGVANGVLVVRDVDRCAELIRRVMLRELDFDIDEGSKDGAKYLYLKEKLSQSIFRVVTGDKLLTNAFWNFYLLSPIE